MAYKEIKNLWVQPKQFFCIQQNKNNTILITSIQFTKLKPKESFGRFVKYFCDLQKMDHTIRKHH